MMKFFLIPLLALISFSTWASGCLVKDVNNISFFSRDLVRSLEDRGYEVDSYVDIESADYIITSEVFRDEEKKGILLSHVNSFKFVQIKKDGEEISLEMKADGEGKTLFLKDDVPSLEAVKTAKRKAIKRLLKKVQPCL